MVRLRVSLVFEYDVENPDDYGTENPQGMAEIDQDNLNEDHQLLIDWMGDAKIKVEVVEE